MNTLKTIISEIKAERENIKSVYFVGCGASKADLYPAKYFLEANAKDLRVSLVTANEFNYSTPEAVNEQAIVITCSLLGTTPETIEASRKAMDLGAKVISVTHNKESKLADLCHYLVINDWEEGYSAKLDKMTKVLVLAVEILHQFEGYKNYDKMYDGLSKIYKLMDEAAEVALPLAKKFAQDYKDEKVIYVMSSGATHEVAYSFSICLLMEMQWIDSGSFHDGEFFHGPFEIVEKDKAFLLLMNDGKTRKMDSRALEFLNRFDAKTTVVDSRDFGLGCIDKSVIDYFNPMLISAVLRVYAEQLSIVRNHPLTRRRYMWKIQY